MEFCQSSTPGSHCGRVLVTSTNVGKINTSEDETINTSEGETIDAGGDETIKIRVSISVPLDRMGNQSNPQPSTLETLLVDEGNVPKDKMKLLGYDGDIMSFTRNTSPGARDDGFSDIIDELVRIYDILSGNPLMVPGSDHEALRRVLESSLRLRHKMVFCQATDTSLHCGMVVVTSEDKTIRVGVILSVALNRRGNRSMCMGASNPQPSTLETRLSSGNVPEDKMKLLGYDGDIMSFARKTRPGAREDGFSGIIDEIVRIYDILSGNNPTVIESDHEDEDVDEDESDQEDEGVNEGGNIGEGVAEGEDVDNGGNIGEGVDEDEDVSVVVVAPVDVVALSDVELIKIQLVEQTRQLEQVMAQLVEQTQQLNLANQQIKQILALIQ